MPAPVRIARYERAQERFATKQGLELTATRFDSSTDRIVRTTNVPTVANITMMGWFKLSVDRNDYQAFLTFNTTGTNNGNWFVGAGPDGVTLLLYNTTADGSNGTVLTVGRWYHVAMVHQGGGAGNLICYLNGVVDTTHDGQTPAGTTLAGIAVGCQASGSADWLNGCAYAVKVYSAVLTPGEIKREMLSVTPQRWRNLNTWLPFSGAWQNSGYDYSGNNFHMTVSGTLGKESGPVVLWEPLKAPWGVYKVPSAGGTTFTTSRDSSITSTSAVVKMSSKSLAGSITGSSTVSKVSSKVLSGSVTAASAVVKAASKALSGSITAVSTLTTSATRSIVLSNSVTAASALVKSVNKTLLSSATASSTLNKLISFHLSSALTVSSATVKRVLKTFSGNITAASTVATSATRSIVFNSVITASSTIVKRVQKSLSGIVTVSSTVVRRCNKVLSGSISAVGAIGASLTKRITLNSSITAASSIIAQFIAGSGDVARKSILWVRRRRRNGNT